MEEILNLLQENQKGLIVLLIAILLDIVSGCLKAIIGHDLKSSVFRTGLLKKLLNIILVIIAFSLDWLLSVSYIGNSVLYFLIAMEFYSVLENVREYLSLPTILTNILDILQKKGDGTDESNKNTM